MSIITKTAQVKIYYNRSGSYLVGFNFALLTINTLYWIYPESTIFVKIIFCIAGLLIFGIWGYLDTKLGIFEAEQEKINKQVPQLYTIINLLVEIKNKLNGTT